MCLVTALHFRVAHLLQHNTPVETYLETVNENILKQIICGKNITAAFCAIILSTGLILGFTNIDLSAKSLLSRVAMELLLAWVDTHTIHMVDRWWINTMLCYICTTTNSFKHSLAMRVVKYGTNTLVTPCTANFSTNRRCSSREGGQLSAWQWMLDCAGCVQIHCDWWRSDQHWKYFQSW